MKTGVKVLLVGLVGLGIWKFLNPEKNEAGVIAGGEIITMHGIAGLPTTLVAGSTGNQAVMTIHNTSTYADGTPAPFTFVVGFSLGASLLSTSLVARVYTTLTLAAGATGTATIPFNIPAGGGLASGVGIGTIWASIQDASAINVATTPVTVSAGGAITPGGTIVF